MRTMLMIISLAAIMLAGCEQESVQPTPKPVQEKGNSAALVEKALENGLKFLFSGQKEDGSIVTNEPGAEQAVLGATSLAVNGAARAPENIRKKYEKQIAKGCEFILTKMMSDGSFQGTEGLPTYTTAIALMALHNSDAVKYAEKIKKAQDYLVSAQYFSDVNPEDVNYGGWTYGKTEMGQGKPANLSTTHFALMALKESNCKDEEAFKRAVIYLQRSQNNSETNDAKGWKVLSDGGFIYGPGMTRADSNKKGLSDAEGNVYYPSYASMTYAGFKSLLYANLPKDDPRVTAALSWIKNNYNLDKNTGMGYRAEEKGKMEKQGIYYYYNAFARAMDAWGEKEIEDGSGAKHDWASELCAKIMEKQAEDGSWVNLQDRWHEGLKSIVTGYCIDALNTCVPWLEK